MLDTVPLPLAAQARRVFAMKAFVTGGSGFVGRNLIAMLLEQGHEVRALARSEGAQEKVRAAGAEPVPGDLDGVAALREGMRGCNWVFHSAATVNNWGPREEFYRVNVQGTQNVLDAARAAGVGRVVHVSTEAVLAGGGPILNADESRPRAATPLGPYGWSKGEAEARVLAANGNGLETVVVRPRFIWGKGDSTLLPAILLGVRSGVFRWFGGGRYLTSTTHVRNTCEGLLLGAQKGRPGEIYFVTDGEPVEFRSFITAMLETQGVPAPGGSIPLGLVKALAGVMELAWRALPLKGQPPLTREVLALVGTEVTVSDAKARRELGYVGHISREAGLLEMKAAPDARAKS